MLKTSLALSQDVAKDTCKLGGFFCQSFPVQFPGHIVLYFCRLNLFRASDFKFRIYALYWFFFVGFAFEPIIEPLDEGVVELDQIMGFSDAMAFIREIEQFAFDAAAL